MNFRRITCASDCFQTRDLALKRTRAVRGAAGHPHHRPEYQAHGNEQPSAHAMAHSICISPRHSSHRGWWRRQFQLPHLAGLEEKLTVLPPVWSVLPPALPHWDQLTPQLYLSAGTRLRAKSR